jgi:hypothetical protein
MNSRVMKNRWTLLRKLSTCTPPHNPRNLQEHDDQCNHEFGSDDTAEAHPKSGMAEGRLRVLTLWKTAVLSNPRNVLSVSAE